MDTFSLLFSAPSPKVEKTIEVNLEDLEQFFNTMDPSPFHEKDLEHDLEEFIVSCHRIFTARSAAAGRVFAKSFSGHGRAECD